MPNSVRKWVRIGPHKARARIIKTTSLYYLIKIKIEEGEGVVCLTGKTQDSPFILEK